MLEEHFGIQISEEQRNSWIQANLRLAHKRDKERIRLISKFIENQIVSERNITENKDKKMAFVPSWHALKSFSTKDENFKIWLKDFELCMEIDNIPEDNRLLILKLKLGQDVREYLRLLKLEKDGHRVTYNELKKILLNKFSSQMSMQNARAKLRNFVLDHKPEYIVKSLEELTSLVSASVSQMDEQALMDYQFSRIESFLKGDLWTRFHNHSFRYKTLTEAFLDLENEAKSINMKGRNKDNDRNSFKNTTFLGTCFFCHKRGHKYVECRSRLNKNNTNNGRDNNESSNNSESTKFKFNNKNSGFYKHNLNLSCLQDYGLPLIEVKVNDSKYTALIDTGANVATIRQSIVLRYNFILEPCDISVRQSCGTVSKPLGKVKIPIKIKKVCKEIELLCFKDQEVDDLYDIILDIKAIKCFNMKIDLPSHLIKINDEEINLIEVIKDYSRTCNNLTLKEPSMNHVDIMSKLEEILPELSQIKKDSENYKESVFEAPKQYFTTDIPYKFVRYQVPKKLKKLMDEKLDYLIKNKIIVSSDTLYLHNIILIKKSDNTYRLCSDMRPTNKITIIDRYPVADLREVLSGLYDFKYFSSLDIKKAFQLIAIKKKTSQDSAYILIEAHLCSPNCRLDMLIRHIFFKGV